MIERARAVPGFSSLVTLALGVGIASCDHRFEETLDLVIGGIMRQELRDVPFEDLLVGDRTLVLSIDTNNFNLIASCADLPTVQ